MGLKFAKTRSVKSPSRAGKREAGLDFYVPNDFKTEVLYAGDSILIPMGVKVKLPKVPDILKETHEYMLELKNKSGVASKKGIVTAACVLDAGYQGEVFLNLHNNTYTFKKGSKIVDNEVVEIKAGDKIVQGILILVNTEEIEETSEDNLYDEVTQRGDKGFGSDYEEVVTD